MELDLCQWAPDDWERSTLDELCERVTSGGTPSRARPEFFIDGVWPWVKTQELNDGWIYDTEEHITDLAVTASSAKVLPAGTLLIAMYGATVGQLGLLACPMTCNQACCALVADGSKADIRFLHYLLLSARTQLRGLATGAAQQNLSGALIKRLVVPHPSVAEQAAIAEVLAAIDDKIELNRRMAATLEEMARALFKSWFVDFDPVRAKVEGRDTGLPSEIADLFPDRLVDSALGEIPDGWAWTSLDRVAIFLNGLALQKYPVTDADRTLPVIKIAQLRAGTTLNADRCSSNIPPAYVVEDGDVLFSWSGSLECAFWAGGRGALNQHLFKVTANDAPPWLGYLGVHHHLPGFRETAAGKATTMGHIQRHHLTDARLPVPPADAIAALGGVLEPMLDRSWKLRVEIRQLTELRDSLLPKLVSGEIRLADPEDFLARMEAVG